MLTATALCLAAMLGADAEGPLVFERSRIGHVTYEAAAAFDVDNDGHTDIVSGGFWFAGPGFETAHKICDVRAVDEYHDDFSSYPMDVNGDGYLDIVTGAFWNATLMWRENPKGQPVEWTTHKVAETGNIERLVFHDLDGDGTPEVLATTSPVHVFKLDKDAAGKGKGSFTQYSIKKGRGGHGLGCGDVNGDGRVDILLSGGWLEAPASPFEVDAWKWHDDWDLGMASVPIVVHDVNEDGLADLLVGNAHGYGLWWVEQEKGMLGKTSWTKHEIDPHRAQFHDVQLADIDNDGQLEMLSGKRYRAHNGHDTGSFDPLGIYYYEINKGDFERVVIDYGPPETASGAGIYFWVADVDKDGWKDVVAPGKEGLHFFRNQGRAPMDWKTAQR